MLDLQTYLDRLASAEPTPGGGSAAAVVGALGAALVAMVARLTLGNPRLAGAHPAAHDVVRDADALRSRFDVARTEDERAYAAVVAAQRLARSTAAETLERTARVQTALQAAAEAPLHLAELAVELQAVAARAAALHNVHAMSDVECAIAFSRAALTAAAANVRINHRYLRDEALVRSQAGRLATLEGSADAQQTSAQAIVTSG